MNLESPDDGPPGTDNKNRYLNILPGAALTLHSRGSCRPASHSRVRLRQIGSDPTTRYINANYIEVPQFVHARAIITSRGMTGGARHTLPARRP